MGNIKQNIVIIGGMAAGCKTAARLKRISPDFNVMTETLVEKIDYNKKLVECLDIKNGNRFSLTFDKLVISTGAKAKKPLFPVPDFEKISTFHNPLDAKKIRELAQTGKIGKAVIIGGGSICCELAESLAGLWGIETHLVELEDRLLPTSLDKEMSRFLEKTFISNEINLHRSSRVEKVLENDEGNPVVYLINGEEIDSDYVFLCIGIEPEVELARSIGVSIGESGGISVDSQMRTNLENVWAGGDCVEVKSLITGKPDLFPYGSLANRQGRVIANSIAGLKSELKGASGAISLKVFGLITASCGLSENNAINEGFNAGVVWGSWHDRPDFHPDAKSLLGKMIYEKGTMKLLGLQLMGRGEVTRYIDVFSVLISNGATANDFLDVEHAYTPPHSSPLNPLNSLGAMAISQEEGGIKALNPLLLEQFDGNILDIREPFEISNTPLGKDAKEYPIMEYRNQINEFDKDEPLLIICQKGPRSYEAVRTFINAGFSNVQYIGGGYQFSKVII